MARKPGEIFVMVSEMGVCWGLGVLEDSVFLVLKLAPFPVTQPLAVGSVFLLSVPSPSSTNRLLAIPSPLYIASASHRLLLKDIFPAAIS